MAVTKAESLNLYPRIIPNNGMIIAKKTCVAVLTFVGVTEKPMCNVFEQIASIIQQYN